MIYVKVTDVHFKIMSNCRYVGLIMDEVHIKDDLVYDNHSGTLVGFVNLGDTNSNSSLPSPMMFTCLPSLIQWFLWSEAYSQSSPFHMLNLHAAS